MQKTLLSLCLVLFIVGAFSSSLYGQTTVSESFDGGIFLPAGWASVGTTNLWTRRTTGGLPTCTNHSGAGMARFAANGSAAKTTQTIASPVIDLAGRGANTPKFSLWIYRDNGSTLGDSLSLYVNTSKSLSGAAWVGTIARYSKLKMPDTVAANGWYQYTFNVPTAFNTNTNYILFKGFGEAGYNIFMDDVQWENYPNQCTGTPSPGTISTSSALICNGAGSATLSLTGQSTGFAGLSFQWKVSSSVSGPFTNFGTNVTAVSTGTITSTKYYKCVATCSFSSMSDSTGVQMVAVTPTLNPVITFTPSPANFCANSTVPLTIKANSATGKTFLWSPATFLNRTDTSEVKSMPTSNTSYSVVVTDSIGCKALSNITVFFRQPPTAVITATDSSMCMGDSIKLTATAGTGYTYVWSPTGSTSNPLFAKPIVAKTNYSVMVKNSNGCTTIVSKNLYASPKPKANFEFKIVGRTVYFYDSSKNAKSYEWDFGDGNYSKKSNPTYTFSEDMNYLVTFIVTNSPCKADTLVKPVYIHTLGIPMPRSNNGLTIYPNPVKNLLKIKVNENTKQELILYNTLGEKILFKTMINNSETIDMSGFVSGIYNLVVKDKGVVFNYRLVKVD